MTFSGSESGPAACVGAVGVSGGAAAEQQRFEADWRSHRGGTGERERRAEQEMGHSGPPAEGQQSAQ